MRFSRKEIEWCKNPDMDIIGVRRLGAELICLAMEDFKRSKDRTEPHSVIKAYFESTALERTIDVFCLKISASAIRRKIGIQTKAQIFAAIPKWPSNVLNQDQGTKQKREVNHEVGKKH